MIYGLHTGYSGGHIIGILEKKIETTILYWGHIVLYRDRGTEMYTIGLGFRGLMVTVYHGFPPLGRFRDCSDWGLGIRVHGLGF